MSEVYMTMSEEQRRELEGAWEDFKKSRTKRWDWHAPSEFFEAGYEAGRRVQHQEFDPLARFPKCPTCGHYPWKFGTFPAKPDCCGFHNCGCKHECHTAAAVLPEKPTPEGE